LIKTLILIILKSQKKATFMSNIEKECLRILEVISTLNCELQYKYGIARKSKMFNLEVFLLSLSTEFIQKEQ
jgi:hypothetical protein